MDIIYTCQYCRKAQCSLHSPFCSLDAYRLFFVVVVAQRLQTLVTQSCKCSVVPAFALFLWLLVSWYQAAVVSQLSTVLLLAHPRASKMYIYPFTSIHMAVPLQLTKQPLEDPLTGIYCIQTLHQKQRSIQLLSMINCHIHSK